MRITILDTKTGKQKVIESKYSSYWWAEGNGGCDCNRAIQMGVDDEMDAAMRLHYPELEDWQSYCYGCKRFLIVKADDDYYTLDEYNQDYPVPLKRKYLLLTLQI